ncbi:AsmA family protein [Chitinophaga arvensicola]|uniref:DUF748 domain-containing protein n=1 Tax=Chitinophaga arvensicola TaxID=29529 RepID=A0A1I0Q172_9BACT|nr:hypothetical protein [Chitinophaga arvensicola]SEW20528.1 hypothetical protein SAMN04488122_1140 [Chitinophaga arvensicola]
MAKNGFNIRRLVKIVLTVAGILTLLVLGTGWYLNQHWNKLLKRELQGYVSDLSDSLYSVKFKDLHLDVLSGSVTIEQASMVADSAVYQRLLAQQRAPSDVYTISVERLEIKYFKPWRYFIGKNLSAGFLTVTGPSIILEQNATVKDTSKPKTAYQNISTKMKSIFIGKLVLDSTNVKYVFIRKDSSRVIHQFHNLRVRINDFLIDSVALDDPTRFLYARNYEIGMKDYMNRTRDSLYWMNVRGIRYDAALRTLHVARFELQPRYDRAAFQRKNGVQQDRFEVVFNDISLHNLNPRLLLQEQQIWAQRVNIQSGKVDIYRDRTLPMPPGNKLGQYPHQLLAKLNTPLNIDTLNGSNINLQYTELSPVTGKAGKINFSHVHGRFHHITNIDSLVAKNKHMTADLDAVFMQSGKLTARFDFLLNDKAGRFDVAGQLNNMNGKDLNVITQPLGKIEIKSCDIRELTFNIKGDERKASGHVKLLYQNLKIAVLKQDKDHEGYKRKGLISFVANALVIKSDNPLKDEKVRTADVNYTRDIQKSFFNLVWKTLFTGVKDIAGAGNL